MITRLDHIKIEKKMAVLEPWEQLIPEQKMHGAIAAIAQSIASRTYSLPSQSKLVIDRSWKKW